MQQRERVHPFTGRGHRHLLRRHSSVVLLHDQRVRSTHLQPCGEPTRPFTLYDIVDYVDYVHLRVAWRFPVAI